MRRYQAPEVTVSFSVHTWFEYHNRAHGSYTGEPDMVEWLKNMLVPGDVFWDIGVNVGAYSILAAKLCPGAHVFSFEPFIPTFAHLWENVVLNDVATQVFPICAGLSDHTAPESLAVSDPRAGSSCHNVGGTDGVLQQGVLAARGDDLCKLFGLPAPTLLKLDIDGLDPSIVPGVIGRAPGGLGYWQTVELIHGVASKARLSAFNLVEFMPERDVDQLGALVCARLIANVLGVVARAKS